MPSPDFEAWEAEMKDTSDKYWPNYAFPDEHLMREHKVRNYYRSQK